MNRIKIQGAIVSRVFMSKSDRAKLTELKGQIKNDARESFMRSESTAPTRSDIEKLVSDRLGKHWYNKALIAPLVDYAKSKAPTQLPYGTMLKTRQVAPDSPTDTGEPSEVKLISSPSLQRGHIEIYETDSVASKGGFGSVYRGPKYFRDGASEPVVMKIISPKKAIANRERTALRAWNDISSPNLVKYHCSAETEDSMLLFMEQCEQGSGELASKLKSISKRAMPLAEKEKIMRSLVAQLLQGVAALHRHDFKHLDIKPGNVMLSPDGVLKIIDAGFATQRTSVKSCGTKGYIAPELAANQPDIDLKMCDAYSAGMTIQNLYDRAMLVNPFHEAPGNRVCAEAQRFLCEKDPHMRMSVDDFLATGLFDDIYPPDELTRTLLQHNLISGKPQASAPSETAATQGSGSSRRDIPDEDLFSSARDPTRAQHGPGRRATKAWKGEIEYAFIREAADWQPGETKPPSTAASSRAPRGEAGRTRTGADPGIGPQAARSAAARPNPRK